MEVRGMDVVTVLLSIVAFEKLTFQKVVYRHIWGVAGSLVIVLLQISPDFNSEKSLKNG